MSEEDSRRAQLEARVLAMESEIVRLKQDLVLGQKALDEGAAVFEAIHLKHQRDVILSDYKLYIVYSNISKINYHFRLSKSVPNIRSVSRLFSNCS